jgi:hypothetical protein
MPTLTVTNPVANIYQVFRDLSSLENATIIEPAGSSELILQFGSRRISLEGSGLTTSTVNGVKKISGGTITGIKTGEHEGSFTQQFAIGGLNLSAGTLRTAIDQENAGQSNTAIEDLFLKMTWDVTGTAGKDAAVTQYSVDGVEAVITGGTTWTMGNEADTVLGGNGNDTIKARAETTRSTGAAAWTPSRVARATTPLRAAQGTTRCRPGPTELRSTGTRTRT